MTRWLLAALLGTALALVAYRARAMPLALLRALAFTLVLALLLDAPAGRGHPMPPLVVLDASASWLRASGDSAWRAALAAAGAEHADTLWLAGDSLRAAPARIDSLRPSDARTLLAPVAARARAAGRALVLVTDGEADDAGALGALPPGSRVRVIPRGLAVDAAVAALEAPRTVVAGDTVAVKVTVRAGNAPVPSVALMLRADGRALAERTLDSLAAGAERVIEFHVPAPARPGTVVLSAVLRAAGDREPRNDTLATALEVSRAAAAVFVSTAPNEEMRFLVPVLRGVLALSARGYFQVAPGAWRRDGTLEHASEGEVREALRSAPLAIVHGDTAIFGAPRTAASGSLLLLPEPREAEGEWYATAAPSSPVAGALAGAPWDSLPPLAAAARAPEGDWTALTIARARRYEAHAGIAGSDRGRRVVVSGVEGTWRWRFAGGAGAGVYDALWGGILDWLAAERRDPRAAVPDAGPLRAGEPLRWRRGGGKADTTVAVTLVRRGGATDTLTLRFTGGMATSPPLPPGSYEARESGGTSLLIVNSSREWLPRTPSLRDQAVAGTPPASDAPPLRGFGLAYLFAIGALASEWLLRRRAGLR